MSNSCRWLLFSIFEKNCKVIKLKWETHTHKWLRDYYIFVLLIFLRRKTTTPLWRDFWSLFPELCGRGGNPIARLSVPQYRRFSKTRHWPQQCHHRARTHSFRNFSETQNAMGDGGESKSPMHTRESATEEGSHPQPQDKRGARNN